MGKTAEQIRNKMKDAFKGSVQTFVATVLVVDEANMTVDVEPIGQAPINDVRLKAGIDQVTDGVVEFPKEGSSVLVGLVGNNENEAVVLKCSDVDKVVINGGSNGGLINIQTLIEELDKTKDTVQKLLDVFNNWTPVPNDGGAALKTVASSILASAELGDYTGMEDEKVTH